MINAVVDVLQSGNYILGDNVAKFEEEFASFIGAKHAITVSSGTAALHLALLSSNIGRGDEVITTPLSFVSTANAILFVGARPVFADIDIETYNIDPIQIEKNLTDKTKAIIPVHLYGHPADMGPILDMAEDHGLKVIEDAAQAHGAEYKGRKVGSIGDVACFSFFPSKVISVCGDGGILTTDNYEMAKTMLMLRNHGRKPAEWDRFDLLGFNYRMSEISAAIGRRELDESSEWISARRRNAKDYSKLLKDIKDITIPFEKEWAKAVYYVYTIRTSERDELREKLRKDEIETKIVYPIPIHLQLIYMHLGFKRGDFPNTERVANEILSIPMHQYLKVKQIRHVAEKIKEFFS